MSKGFFNEHMRIRQWVSSSGDSIHFPNMLELDARGTSPLVHSSSMLGGWRMRTLLNLLDKIGSLFNGRA